LWDCFEEHNHHWQREIAESTGKEKEKPLYFQKVSPTMKGRGVRNRKQTFELWGQERGERRPQAIHLARDTEGTKMGKYGEPANVGGESRPLIP